MGIFIVVHVVSEQAVSLCLGWLKFKANPEHLAQGLQSWSGQAPCLLPAPHLGPGRCGPGGTVPPHKQLLALLVPHST